MMIEQRDNESSVLINSAENITAIVTSPSVVQDPRNCSYRFEHQSYKNHIVIGIMKMHSTLGLLIGYCLTASITANTILKRPGKVIIDTDVGGDDAAAILLTIIEEERSQGSGLEIIAITCSYGNTEVSNVGSNVLKVLTIGNRSDIPVYIGAQRPLTQNYTQDNFFGDDGLGDIFFGEEIIGKIDRSKPASVALVDLARQHAGEISILALAPVTNIALAMSLDPNFVHNVERFYIMGSSVHGVGNIAPNVEFNFFQDPESNFIVLNSTTTPPAELMPWETILRAPISMKWRTEILGALDSRIINFLNQVERNHFNRPTWNTADLVLVALALWPELVEKTIETNVTPVFDGAAKGSVLVDYARLTGKEQNAIILDSYDVKKFQQLLLEYFS